MNNISSQNIMEEQIKSQLQVKKALQAKLLERNPDSEELKSLNEDISKIQDVYNQLKNQRRKQTNFEYPRDKI